MNRVFLGLGSNIGNRMNFLQAAVDQIEALPGTRIDKASSVYETEPVGEKKQSYFLNMTLELQTALPATSLYVELENIERRSGRVRTQRWGPREIDIDILYYGTQVTDDGQLKIPHPELGNRRFVLVPLAELAPEFRDPASFVSVRDLLEACPDRSSVEKTRCEISFTTQEF